jgi:hypothetical protein
LDELLKGRERPPTTLALLLLKGRERPPTTLALLLLICCCAKDESPVPIIVVIYILMDLV